jgi:hypothetical protein
LNANDVSAYQGLYTGACKLLLLLLVRLQRCEAWEGIPSTVTGCCGARAVLQRAAQFCGRHCCSICAASKHTPLLLLLLLLLLLRLRLCEASAAA